MRDGAPKTIYRKDYQVPVFSVTEVAMRVQVFDGYSLVDTELSLLRTGQAGAALTLDGEQLALEHIAIDGVELSAEQFIYDGHVLTIPELADSVKLETRVKIHPEDNTSLEGLYRSRTIYCTQCEAEGFRKITFFPDRPDVLATFTVTLEADAATCPVLLSNGNLVSEEPLPEGRHRAIWHDPWPKPCYLFAMVAGDLECYEDSFVTASGRAVALKIYVEAKDTNYCGHAMDSLKRSMRWDEEIYGLEYDLDLFNIVAVDDFNMGAMENKGLNIFNTSCVLASPDITTDMGYQRVEAIVAHEYFHNYSGNRVTCRDWFQLSLKEGFTVFRDSEFSGDMNSRGVKRVEDVQFLRTHQFAEDSGPMSHPVRPDSFIEISNFYTLTVYEKGAEVVRMLHTLLGHKTFIEGAKYYFERYDGQAVTCDDFVVAMETASGRDLQQFRRWYEQAGTPTLSISGAYDVDAQRYTLHVSQSNIGAADQAPKPPLHIPLALGLLCDGEPVTLSSGTTTELLEITDLEQSFVFEGICSEPVPSLLRDFSAPVRLEVQQSERDLQVLIANDDNDFVRWDAFQRYATQVIDTVAAGGVIADGFIDAYQQALVSDIEPAVKAQLLSLPTEDYLADIAANHGLVDVFAIRNAREAVKRLLATHFEQEWRTLYASMLSKREYQPTGEQIGRRALRQIALDYLGYTEKGSADQAHELLASADNLTDRLACLRQLLYRGGADKAAAALASFYEAWQHEALIVNQWFSLQAMWSDTGTVDHVLQLQQHEAFDWRNPNKIRALIGAFANGNPVGFHRKDGAGYTLLADAIITLQSVNPQIAARLCTPLTRYKRYAHGSGLMKAELQRIADVPDLSRDVFEVVERSLSD